VNGVPWDLLKWDWQYSTSFWSILWGSVMVRHWEGSVGSGMRSLLSPPGLRGFMNWQCSWKHRRFSSARFRCRMSLRRWLSLVAFAASKSELRCSCRFRVALRRISRSCRRSLRRFAEMVLPFSGEDWSLFAIRWRATE